MLLKKYLIALLAILSIFSAGHADASLSRIPQEEICQEAPFELDQDTCEKYQAAARFFSASDTKDARASFIQANLITYETTTNGVHVIVGWYPDGIIGTALDGPEQGKQIIMLSNGSITAVSIDAVGYNDHFEHFYTWGKVYTYPNSQIVQFY